MHRQAHIHCIVSGGGIRKDGRWKEATKNDWRFLFPVKAMSRVFKGKFLEALKKLIETKMVIPTTGTDVRGLLHLLYQKDWIIYAKAPFGGPHAVIEYLGRYTHKVAVSNHRLSAINDKDDTVTFDYKDYADNSKLKQMTISGSEFIRRFEQHILPERFTKIRTYGYLANRNRHQRINTVLSSMKLPRHKERIEVPLKVRMIEQYGIDLNECPCCKGKTLELIRVFNPWKNNDDG